MPATPLSQKHHFHFKDSFVFVGSVVLSALIAMQFVSLRAAIIWTSFSVLSTYSLYNAKPDRSNLFDIVFWMIIISASTFVGVYFHLTWKLYLFLFVVSYFYYYLFGKDPVTDRAMRFIVVLTTIGTALPEITEGLPIGAAIGTFSALIVCHYLKRKNTDLSAFKQGIFTHDLFKLKTNLIPRSLIYSLGMSFALWLPHYLGIEKNYWATITFVMVMTPKATTVIQNTWKRFWGSIFAIGFLFLLFQIPHYLHVDMEWFMLALLVAFSFILPLCFGPNYMWVTFGVTCYSLVLVEIAMFWTHPMMGILGDRIIETVIGGVIAIVTSWILRALRYN